MYVEISRSHLLFEIINWLSSLLTGFALTQAARDSDNKLDRITVQSGTSEQDEDDYLLLGGIMTDVGIA